MANVLRREKQEQVCALGRLGWSLRRIEEETGVRRETASSYLKRAEIDIRKPRGRRLDPGGPGSKPASQVTADPEPDPKPASQVTTDPGPGSKPASQPTADLERSPSPHFSPTSAPTQEQEG